MDQRIPHQFTRAAVQLDERRDQLAGPFLPHQTRPAAAVSCQIQAALHFVGHGLSRSGYILVLREKSEHGSSLPDFGAEQERVARCEALHLTSPAPMPENKGKSACERGGFFRYYGRSFASNRVEAK